MKKDKSCKTRKGESTIGKIIYGFLLFAPLFAMLTTCMYVIFNKNAYQSYNGEYTKTEEQQLTIDSIFQENIQYTITNQTQQRNVHYIIEVENLTSTYKYNIKNAKYFASITTYYTAMLPEIENLIKFTYYDTGVIKRLCIITDNNGSEKTTNIDLLNEGNRTININNVSYEIAVNANQLPRQATFYYKQNELTGYNSELEQNKKFINNWLNPILSTGAIQNGSYKNYIYDNKLTNVFYASTKQVESSNLFNWTTNTLIYQGIQATASILGITNTFIPMLLAYWLIISILYFIYDIVLMIILILHDKIHELQESI